MVKYLKIRFFILFFFSMFFCLSKGLAAIIIPPGTVLLDRNTKTYIDLSEVTVIGWLEYLSWIKENKGESSNEYKAALPDSATCERLYGAVRYFQHPKYRYYPIVGISYEQAMNYCKWRSDRVNQNVKKGKIVYLLPDVSDFRLALKKQKKVKRKSSGIQPINFKVKSINGIGCNVQEYTSDPKVVLTGTEGDNLLFEDFSGINYQLGFRCKAIIINE